MAILFEIESYFLFIANNWHIFYYRSEKTEIFISSNIYWFRMHFIFLFNRSALVLNNCSLNIHTVQSCTLYYFDYMEINIGIKTLKLNLLNIWLVSHIQNWMLLNIAITDKTEREWWISKLDLSKLCEFCIKRCAEWRKMTAVNWVN